MARYHVDNTMGGTQQATTTTMKTQISVTAVTATLCRGRMVGIAVGPTGAPNATDCNVVFAVFRQTAAGTGTSVTPNPIVAADVASRSAGTANYTGEPTAALNVWARALNQRSSMQWVGQDTDANLLWPATNLAGLAGQCLTAASGAYVGPVFFGFDYEDQ